MRAGHSAIAPKGARACAETAASLAPVVSGAPTPTGPKWRHYIAIGALILAAIFVLQNSQKVEVKFFFSQTDTPLIFALLLAVGLGFVIGLALPRFTGRDRRHDD